MVIVVNVRTEQCDVSVCRPTIYGNFPGIAGKTRDEAVAMYAQYFYSELGRKIRIKALLEIPDHSKIGCYCAPLRCHADIIAGYLNWKRNYKFDGPKARTIIYDASTIN